MKVSEKGKQNLKKYEGLRLKAYKCSAGVWTIGYGTTKINGKPVTPGMKINKQEANRLFELDLKSREKIISDLVTINTNQNEFDSLVSFAYNFGTSALKNSTLLELHNKSDRFNACNEFHKWRNIRVNGRLKVEKGLVIRRLKEALHYIGG